MTMKWQAISVNFLCKQMDRMTGHPLRGVQKNSLNMSLDNNAVDVVQLCGSENRVIEHLRQKPPEWRTLAMHELRVLIDAGNTMWMDVDDGLSDALYARRGFDIIRQVLDR